MLNKQAILFLGLAVVLGIAAAFAARNWLAGQMADRAGASQEMIPVVMARVDVSVGTALTSDQLDVARWPRSYLPAGAISSPDRITGRVTRRPLIEGEPVLESALLPDGSEAGLVAVIEENKRAFSVKVDPVIGVAGFVKPGARVDVLATLRRVDLKDKLPYSKVILQDVRVLAIDQKLEEAKNGDAHLVSVVTLEVDPEQAEKLTYISHEGRLQLALRNPADHEMVKTKSTGVVDLLPRRSPRSRARATSTRVQVIKGSNLSSRSF